MKAEFVGSPVDDDSVVLLPCLVVTQARCECCDRKQRAFALTFQWLLWGFAWVVDFGEHQ